MKCATCGSPGLECWRDVQFPCLRSAWKRGKHPIEGRIAVLQRRRNIGVVLLRATLSQRHMEGRKLLRAYADDIRQDIKSLRSIDAKLAHLRGLR